MGWVAPLAATVAAVWCVAGAALAQAPIQNSEARAGASLSGSWQVIVDPARVGSVSPFEGFPPVAFQSAKPWSDDMVLQEWAFDPSVTLRVPGDWNTQDPRLLHYDGDVWYKLDLPIPDDLKPDERLFVQFGAANYRTTVWLNGAPLGEHEGGFTPFAFEITAGVRPGANVLVTRVRAALDPAAVPTQATDWHNYGGITRDVRLIRTPKVFVRDYVVRLTDHEMRTVTATVQLDGAGAGAPVSVSLPGLGEMQRAVTDASGVATVTWRTRAGLWSPQTPVLHDVVIEAGPDRVRDRIGLRTIATKGPDILLNGKPIFLKGVSAHEESLLHAGRSHSAADARATLQLIRDLNGNFIRLAHYPHDEATARMADEMGILVWAELPLYWGMDWDNPETLANARAQAEAMVRRDRNRASVVLWSIANETPKRADRLAFLSQIAGAVRTLDPSRPITAALYGDPLAYAGDLARTIAARLALRADTPAEQKARLTAWLAGAGVPAADVTATAARTPLKQVDDPLGDVVDVIGINQYLG